MIADKRIFSKSIRGLNSYDIMKEGSVTIDPLETLPYSPLAVQFIDRFGVQWGFMVEENAV
jgi:PhnB protein